MKYVISLEQYSWDEEYMLDLVRDRAINIKEQPFTKEEKNLHGSHSPLFATDWDDDDPFVDRNTCLCKKLKGKLYMGEECPECKTLVELRDVDLKLFGWMVIDEFKIIQPGFYKQLESFIGASTLNDIIKFEKDQNRDGHLIDKKTDVPFKGIGLVEFYDKYEDILIYFRNKKKHKEEFYQHLVHSKNSVFASAIPQYSPILRPVSFKGESLFFNPVDKIYNYINPLILLLNKKLKGDTLKNYRKKRQMMDMPTILYTIQTKLIELHEKIFIEISQKEGHIKSNILGGRVNLSARNVIIPDPTLKADRIDLSYLTFLELYKAEIKAHLCSMDNITNSKATDIWFKATITFSERVYEIMNYILKKYKCSLLINRNPKHIGALYRNI